MPISELGEGRGGEAAWLWDGLLPFGHVALLSAQPKLGKTTLLAHLLAALSRGEPAFLGRPLAPARALVVTQEADPVWLQRRRELGLCPRAVFFQRGRGGWPQPFRGRPGAKEWAGPCAHLAAEVARLGLGLAVIDPLADFWPVRDENAAGEVTDAVLPLREVAHAGAAVLLLHHPRKAGGQGGAAHRGSVQLAALADVLLELRRPRGAALADPRRVLSGAFAACPPRAP